MGYISEDYCSEELSGMLMEKGYIGATNTYLGKDDINVKQITLQSAMKWLREEYYIFIYIIPSLRYWGSDYKWDKEHPWFLEGYQPHVFHGDNPHEFRVIDKYYVSTYEEACESAVRYCLENLI